MKLQARMLVEPGQVDLAGRDFEVPVNEAHQPVGQIGRKVWPVIRRSVFPQPARDVNPRIFLIGQLDIRVSFVVAKQDIEARLPLLDQVIFESQRLFFVVDQDVFQVCRGRDQAGGLGIQQPLFRKIIPNPML